MKIVVMGAGIIGVTTAYFLARSGFEVEVIEKNEKAGLGCSFANGSQLSFSHVEPFSSKSSFSLILKSFFKPNSFTFVESFFDKDFLRFCLNLSKNYGDEKTKNISRNLYNLGQESKNALEFILKSEDFDFDYSQNGILHFFRKKDVFEKAMKQADFQVDLGDDIEFLTADSCVETEPTLTKLNDEKRLIGGILHKNDASGNAMILTQKLAQICKEKYNVVFHYNTEIKNILTNFKKITGINTDKNVYVGDSYVYCLGAYGNKLLEGIEVDSKIFPVKGYSLSIPTDNEFLAPKIALTDPENKIVYSRIGNTFRAAGTIEISNCVNENQKLINFIKNKVRNSFSDFGNLNQATTWQGIRPFRANSIPLIKQYEKYPNLFLNSGHGHLGFSMSFGSAKVLSDLILGKESKKFNFLKEQII